MEKDGSKNTRLTFSDSDEGNTSSSKSSKKSSSKKKDTRSSREASADVLRDELLEQAVAEANAVVEHKKHHKHKKEKKHKHKSRSPSPPASHHHKKKRHGSKEKEKDDGSQKRRREQSRERELSGDGRKRAAGLDDVEEERRDEGRAWQGDCRGGGGRGGGGGWRGGGGDRRGGWGRDRRDDWGGDESSRFTSAGRGRGGGGRRNRSPVPIEFNPKVNRVAEEVNRRKLLFQRPKAVPASDTPDQMPGPSAAPPPSLDKGEKTWETLLASSEAPKGDLDKFRKLMGIRKPAPAPADAAAGQKTSSLQEGLDRQYELARMATHTHRGMGLGFGSI